MAEIDVDKLAQDVIKAYPYRGMLSNRLARIILEQLKHNSKLEAYSEGLAEDLEWLHVWFGQVCREEHSWRLQALALAQEADELEALLEGSCEETRQNFSALMQACAKITSLKKENEALRAALQAYMDAYPHDAPNDCFSTGPNTGNVIEDHIVCPGCRAERMAISSMSPLRP